MNCTEKYERKPGYILHHVNRSTSNMHRRKGNNAQSLYNNTLLKYNKKIQGNKTKNMQHFTQQRHQKGTFAEWRTFSASRQVLRCSVAATDIEAVIKCFWYGVLTRSWAERSSKRALSNIIDPTPYNMTQIFHCFPVLFHWSWLHIVSDEFISFKERFKWPRLQSAVNCTSPCVLAPLIGCIYEGGPRNRFCIAKLQC